MASELYAKIRNNPKFIEMVDKRSRFSWTLTVLVLVIFYSFILVVAFAPGLLAIPLWSGATTTIGVPIGVGMIAFFWLLTGYYISRANKEFDTANEVILREAAE